jgi:hypothetical protein
MFENNFVYCLLYLCIYLILFSFYYCMFSTVILVFFIFAIPLIILSKNNFVYCLLYLCICIYILFLRRCLVLACATLPFIRYTYCVLNFIYLFIAKHISRSVCCIDAYNFFLIFAISLILLF